MRKEELIQEISYRMAVPEQTASLVLHTIFNQVLIGLERDGAAGIPRLGDWRLLRREGKQEIEFIPSHQFIRILGFARSNPALPPGDRTRGEEAPETTPGYLPVEQLYPPAGQQGNSVDVIALYRSIRDELGIESPLARSASEPTPDSLPIDAEKIYRAITAAEREQPRASAEPTGIRALSPDSFQEIPAAAFVSSAAETPIMRKEKSGASSEPGRGDNTGETEHPADPHQPEPESIPPEPRKKRTGGDAARNIAILLSLLITLGALYLAYVNGYLDHLVKKHSPAPPAPLIHRADSAPAPAIRPGDRIVPGSGHLYLLSVRITPRRYEADGRLKQIGLQGFHGKVTSRRLRRSGSFWYEVRLGPYSTRDSARLVSEEFLQTYGFPPELDSIRVPQ